MRAVPLWSMLVFALLFGGAVEGSPNRAQAHKAAAATGSGTLVVINAQAHTMTSRGVIEGATIVVRDGRIEALGADVAVPAGVKVIDARGSIVTPGLFSSATQLGLVEVTSSQDTVDRSESAGRLGAAFDIQYGLNFNSTLIPVARADGLTHGIVLPSESSEAPFAGVGAMLKLGPGNGSLERASVAMFANLDSQSTSDAGRSRSADWIVLRNALAQARAQGRGRHRELAALDLEQSLSRADIQALGPVLAGSMPLVIRARRESDIRQAVALATEFGIRVIIYEGNEAWRVAGLLATHRIPVVLDPSANLPRRFDEIGSRLENAALLHEAGVPLGFFVAQLHMSHNAGLELRQVAGLAVANGLPWHAALEALTSGAASIWGADAHIGRLEPGRAADFVIWDGDPLEVTSMPTFVLLDGLEVSLDTRQKQLRDAYHPARAGRAAQAPER